MKSSARYILLAFCLLQAFIITIPLNAQHQPDSILGWEWDTLHVDWEPDFRNVYTFNDEKLIITDHHFRWYGDGWGNSRLKTNTYDDADNLIQEKFDRWINGWTNNSIYDYTYDEFGNQTSETRRPWADTAYQNEYKYVFAYDNDHHLVTKLRQWWLSSGVWDTNIKETFTYDDQGNLIHKLQEGWLFGWQPSFQVFYSYNDFNQLDTSLEQTFIDPGFRNDMRIINVYDDNHNLVSSTREDFMNGTLRFSRRNLYSYTPDNDLHTDVTQLFENGQWVNRNLFVYETDEQDRIISRVELGWQGSWEKIDSIHYYFNAISAVHDQNAGFGFSLFPNPATDQLSFRLLDGVFEKVAIQIFSTSGVKVYDGLKSPGEQVNINQLLPGRYFVNCRVGDRVFTKGFVKI